MSLCLQLSTSLLTDSFGRFFSSLYFNKSQKYFFPDGGGEEEGQDGIAEYVRCFRFF